MLDTSGSVFRGEDVDERSYAARRRCYKQARKDCTLKWLLCSCVAVRGPSWTILYQSGSVLGRTKDRAAF